MSEREDNQQADNIISLEDRLKKRAGEESRNEDASVSGEERRNRVEPIPGKLIWLYCPSCGTLQYTEVVVPGGRVHNTCGSQVEEAVLDIDVRAEFTLAQLNLDRLRLIREMLQAEQARFEEYQERLSNIAGERPQPYPLVEETLQSLPIAEVDGMGLLVPDALHNPGRHFESLREKTKSAGKSDPDPESPTE